MSGVDDERRLKEKLRGIEALYGGATTPGERDAAGRARERILARLEQHRAEAPIEWQFTTDAWSNRLLRALAQRYSLRLYRYPRQRHSTLVLRAPEKFLREVFLPQYDRMQDVLNEHLDAVAERVIAEVLEHDDNGAAIAEVPQQIEAFDKK